MLRLSTPNIGNQEIEAVSEVLLSGNLVFGQNAKKFEQSLADFVHAKHCVLVSSGTAALHISLVALNIKPGDAVIIPGFSFPATSNAVRLCGAIPVFSDVSPLTYGMTLETCIAAYKNWVDKTAIKAIMPVHEFGQPCELERIREFADSKNLLVIEDAACALGAKYLSGGLVGSKSLAACFSFHPRKSATTGEGGAIATNDDQFANRLRLLRNHGIEYSENGPQFDTFGFNYRMTDIQAAIGLVQLRKLPESIRLRQKLAIRYIKNLKDSPITTPENSQQHSWQTFMVTLPEYLDRDEVIVKLKERKIETNIGAHALRNIGANKDIEAGQIITPESEHIFSHGLALPMCELYSEEDIDNVCSSLLEVTRDMSL